MSYIWFIKEKAKELNENKTDAEKEFEKALKITMLPYKSNKIIEKRYCKNQMKAVIKYIVDFLVLDIIVIEIDGGYHSTEEQKKKDEERDEWLRSYGFIVYRITNEEVFDGKSLDILRNICRENGVKYSKTENKYYCKDLRKYHLAKIKEYKQNNANLALKRKRRRHKEKNIG